MVVVAVLAVLVVAVEAGGGYDRCGGNVAV